MLRFLALALVAIGCASQLPLSAELSPLERIAARAIETYRDVCDRCYQVRLIDTEDVNYATMTLVGGVAELRYSPAGLASIQFEYGDDAALGIFLHELGHALASDIGGYTQEKYWLRELAADEWAGCMLAGSSASLTGLLKFYETRALLPSGTHPGGEMREAAALHGAASCEANRGPYTLARSR